MDKVGRVISTAIQFIDGFTKPSKEVIASMKKMGNEAIKAGKQIQNAGKTITAVGSTLTKSITLPILGVATAAVKTAADFETSMSQVAATMGKSKNEIGELTELAKRMGRATSFSAGEAADGINILAMAGLNASEISASLGTVLDLAAAGAMDMGSSASYVVGAVKGFRDEMGNASKYADLMAKGATLANTDVAGLGEALSYGAATAAGYSQSVDSMTLSLLRLAEQNVTGQTAATSLNRAMADLYSPTKEAKKALESLGVSAYTADGSTRDFNMVVDELSSALKRMTEAEGNALKSTIFTTNGMNAFNKMTASTSERVKELHEGLNEAGGSAAQQAATQLDNLNGQIIILKSAIEGIAITIGDKLLPYIKKAVSWFQTAADYINNLSDAQVNNIMKWAGIVAAVGPAIMIFGKIVTTVGTAVRTFGKITKAIANFNGIVGMLTSPAGIVIGVLVAIAVVAVLIIKNWDKVKSFLSDVGTWFKNAFEKAGFSVEGFKNKFASISNTIAGIADKISRFCKSIASVFKKDFAGSIGENVPKINKGMQAIVGGAVAAFDGIITAVDKGLKAFSALLDFFTGGFIGNWDNAAESFRDSLKSIFPPDIADGLIKAFDKALPFITAVTEGLKASISGMVKDAKRIFESFKIVLSGVRTFFKGIFTGDMKMSLNGFKTACNGILDTIGNIFKTKINAIKNFVVTAFSNFLPEGTMNKISKIFDVVTEVWEIAISAAKGFVEGFAQAIKPLFESIKTVLKGVAVFIKGIFTNDWRDALNGLKLIADGALSALGNTIKAAFSGIVNAVKEAFNCFDNSIIKDWCEKNRTALELAGVAVATITALLIAYNASAIASAVASGAETVAIYAMYAADGAAAIAKGALTAATTLWSTVAGVATTVTSGLAAAVTFLTSPIAIVIIAIGAAIAIGILLYRSWDKIKVKASELGQKIQSSFKSVQNFLANWGKSVVSTVKNAVSNMIAGAAERLQNIKEVFTSAFNKVTEAVPVIKIAMDIAKSYISNAVTIIKNIVNGIKIVFNGITDFISGVFTGNWSKAWEGIKTIFKGVFESLAALCKSPINAVISIINGAISGINKLGLTIPDWVPLLGGNSFSINIPTIPMLYKGTDNWQGGAAMIHDRGAEIVDLPKGTRVYPHDKSISMARQEGAASAGRSGISITIQKLADKIEVRSDEDIDRIAEALALKLKKIALNTSKA